MSATTGLSTYTELVDVIEKLPMILRETRRRRGLSLRDVAAETGLSFSTVNRVESGSNSVLSSAVTIMLWLDSKPPP